MYALGKIERMQIPRRRATSTFSDQDDSLLLTEEGKRKIERDMIRLKAEHPHAVAALQAAKELGDLSENAEYSAAKGRLARINEQLVRLEYKLKHAQIIEETAQDGRVHIGSRVTVRVNAKEKTYTIVGGNESNPTLGRISHVSPLAKALLNQRVGDEVSVTTEAGTTTYCILAIE